MKWNQSFSTEGFFLGNKPSFFFKKLNVPKSSCIAKPGLIIMHFYE